MRKESSLRDCPFCNAKGITHGEMCDICKGARKIVLRCNLEPKMNKIEIFDKVCNAIKEEMQ